MTKKAAQQFAQPEYVWMSRGKFGLLCADDFAPRYIRAENGIPHVIIENKLRVGKRNLAVAVDICGFDLRGSEAAVLSDLQYESCCPE